jgi:5-methyltetrahydropteroyltriglutamate--homocysteine methyltransferase
VLGIYPRPPKLIEATRKNDRRLPAMFQTEKKKLIREQQKARLSFICDPLLDWNDMFRPFTSVKGINVGALNRFFETNTFYRKLIVDDKLDEYGSIVKSNLALRLVKKEMAACMPDPYTFTDLNENRFYKNSDYILAIADMLNKEAQTLARAGVKFIQLNAPSIAYNGEKVDLSLVKDSIERVKRNVKSKVYLHLYFGNVSKIFGKLLDMKIDGLNIDLSTTDLDSISGYRVDNGLCLGVVDAMNTKMEEENGTAKKVADAFDRMQPKEAYISTTCDLEFLPYEFAVKKLSKLGRIARSVKYG